MITVLVIFWYGFGNLLFSDYTDLNMIAPIICKRIMVWHPGQGRSLLISGTRVRHLFWPALHNRAGGGLSVTYPFVTTSGDACGSGVDLPKAVYIVFL